MQFVIFIACLLLAGCSSLNRWMGLQDDNLIEEASEVVIEATTGVEMDLTPGSPEK